MAGRRVQVAENLFDLGATEAHPAQRPDFQAWLDLLRRVKPVVVESVALRAQQAFLVIQAQGPGRQARDLRELADGYLEVVFRGHFTSPAYLTLTNISAWSFTHVKVSLCLP